MTTTLERPGLSPADFAIQQLSDMQNRSDNETWKSKAEVLKEKFRQGGPNLDQLMAEADNLMLELGE